MTNQERRTALLQRNVQMHSALCTRYSAEVQTWGFGPRADKLLYAIQERETAIKRMKEAWAL